MPKDPPKYELPLKVKLLQISPRCNYLSVQKPGRGERLFDQSWSEQVYVLIKNK